MGGIRQEKERVVLSPKGSKPDGNWSLKEAANERKRNECLRKKIGMEKLRDEGSERWVGPGSGSE